MRLTQRSDARRRSVVTAGLICGTPLGFGVGTRAAAMQIGDKSEDETTGHFPAKRAWVFCMIALREGVLQFRPHIQMNFTTREPPVNMFEEFPDLHGLARRCIRLHPRAAPSTRADLSKMGGAFLQPEAEPWPSDAKTGQEYYPVLQVLRKDLKRPFPDAGELFPFQEGTDCFQLLWVPRSDEELPPHILARWLNSGSPGMSSYVVRFRKGKHDQLFPRECKLHPEEILEYPHRWALSKYLAEVTGTLIIR